MVKGRQSKVRKGHAHLVSIVTARNKMASGKVHSTPRLHAPPRLSPAEREAVSAVLQDCVDQLAILGGIMPSYNKASAVDAVMGDELKQILESQRQLESEFDHLNLGSSGGTGKLKEHAYSLNATAQVAKNPKAVQENMTKLQSDREFIQELMTDTLSELSSEGSFTHLSANVRQCHQDKLGMEQAILKEEECRKRVRKLKKQLVDLKRDKQEELSSLSENVAHLKDQLQELKAKTNLEAKYIKKESQVAVEVSQRRQGNDETSLRGREYELMQQMNEESRVSERIEAYLKKHYEELAGKVDHWMTKHEQDLDMKSREVHDLKQNKASGLIKLEELTKQYNEFNEVVVEHRLLKEKQRLKAEQEERENKAATKVQAWWKGTMVRKQLGPYAKKKGKKGKGKGKGKKGKKGKKKKK